jgi:hypothetical protein
MAAPLASFPSSHPSDPSSSSRPPRAARFQLDAVSDDALHAGVKSLAGRHNALTAELLAHLAEVDARGVYRERACSSLYTYCVYELRLSEDEAQRRSRAARTARAFPVLFEMMADGAVHLTGLLLLAPYLTPANHAELLARARFRTKREIEHLVAEIAPRADVPARIEPLGPRPPAGRNLWQAYMASLRGAVRELGSGLGARQAPPAIFDDPMSEQPGALPPSDVQNVEATTSTEPLDTVGASSAPALIAEPLSQVADNSMSPIRYHVQFTASQRYVELLEEARNLLQHQVPNRDVARLHELAMAAFVEQLRKRRQAASDRPRQVSVAEGSAPARVKTPASGGSAPARVKASSGAERHVPAAIRGRSGGGTMGAAPSRIRTGGNTPSGLGSRSITSMLSDSGGRRRSRIFGSFAALTTRCSRSAISGAITSNEGNTRAGPALERASTNDPRAGVIATS